jgi:hypothetical protein
VNAETPAAMQARASAVRTPGSDLDLGPTLEFLSAFAEIERLDPFPRGGYREGIVESRTLRGAVRLSSTGSRGNASGSREVSGP